MHGFVRLRRQERWALVLLALAGLAVVLLPLAGRADLALFTWQLAHAARARSVAEGVDVGVRLALLVVAGCLGWHTRAEGMGRALGVFAAGAFVGELLKTAIERPRPSAAAGVLAGNSLPSGHIMNTTIAAVLLCVLAARTDWSRRTKSVVLAVAVVAVVGQVVGRVLHGSHWPSDVAPSVLLGVAWVLGTGRIGQMRRATRVSLAAAALAAYAFFWALPAARFHVAAPERPDALHSHAGVAERAKL